jgi:hypothetical protein
MARGGLLVVEGDGIGIEGGVAAGGEFAHGKSCYGLSNHVGPNLPRRDSLGHAGKLFMLRRVIMTNFF